MDILTIALEDCIMQKGKPATAGAKMLKGFVAPFDAAVVTKLKNSDIKITETAEMSEFGIAPLLSPEPDNAPGAVLAVADGSADAALCNDFSGVIRKYAPQNGVCHIHPTYGTVSRYGLIPSVSSMDSIGVVCRELEAGFKVLSVIAGKDENDGAMYPEKEYAYLPLEREIKLGVPENVISSADETEKNVLLGFAENFEALTFELKYYDVFNQVMRILSSAEICNNINRYDGVKFGYRASAYRGVNELYVNSRTEAFSLDTKLAAVIGSMVLSQGGYAKYYDKAMRIRRLIAESLEFDKYDAIALPSREGALAALAGLPAVTFPYNGGSVQLVAAPKNENALFAAWKKVVSL